MRATDAWPAGTLAAILLLGAVTSAASQEHVHPPGSSPEQLGTVHFPTSCKPAVAPQFLTRLRRGGRRCGHARQRGRGKQSGGDKVTHH